MTDRLTTPIYLISADNLQIGNYVEVDGTWRRLQAIKQNPQRILVFTYFDKQQNKDIVISKRFADGAFVHARSEWAYAGEHNLEEFGLLLKPEEAAA